MGLFERKLRKRVKRELKAEDKQAKVREAEQANERRLNENIGSLERFNQVLEDQIKNYRQKAKQAQKDNNKAAFNSYVAQVLSMQKLLDSNTLMTIDAIRHADSQKVNRYMMSAQATIGELVNPKIDITPKEMMATREKFVQNALNLSTALQRDEEFSSMFEGIYTGEDSIAAQAEFDKLANELSKEAAMDEIEEMDNDFAFMTAKNNKDVSALKEQARREREALQALRK